MQPCACDAEIDPALTPPVARLRHRYVCEEMSTYQIARALGISRMVVLRNAHELGLPVRAYGPSRAGAAAPEIELVEALYADPLVRRTLERHDLPQVPPGGPIWRRFPEPVPLSEELLYDRPPGGRSPFIRRWLAGAR